MPGRADDHGGVGASITGVAMALPDRLISNEELAADLGVDPDWIAKRTGTRERPWASGEERLSQLAAQAGSAARACGRRRRRAGPGAGGHINRR